MEAKVNLCACGCRKAVNKKWAPGHNSRVRRRPTVTITEEVILGGIRFDPGTYEIRRVSEPPADETPF